MWTNIVTQNMDEKNTDFTTIINIEMEIKKSYHSQIWLDK
jgi:hypothetical protein